MESYTVTLPVSDAGAEIDSTRSSINFIEMMKQRYRDLDLKTTIVESCYRSSIRCFTRRVAAGDETDSVRSLINFKEVMKQRYRDLDLKTTIVESCYRSSIRCFTRRVAAGAEIDSTRSSINFKEKIKQRYRDLKTTIEESCYRSLIGCFMRRVAAGDETDSVISLNCKFKEMIEQNPDLKTIAAYFYSVLIPGFKSKVAAVVEKIDCLLATAGSLRLAVISNCNLEELDLETVAGGHDNDWPNLIRDDLDLHPVNPETMALICRQQDRISNLRRSVDRRRRGYNATITITVVIILVGSAWLQVNMEGPAAVVLNTLALVIKAVETWVNVILSEEERMLKEDEEVVKMMRDGEWLMVHEFDDVQQQAKTLNEEIMAEHSKLAEHIQRMEKLEMVKTIVEIECRLKALKRIVRSYGYNVQQFFLKFSAMVIN